MLAQLLERIDYPGCVRSANGSMFPTAARFRQVIDAAMEISGAHPRPPLVTI
jgi:hypothetical protein